METHKVLLGRGSVESSRGRQKCYTCMREGCAVSESVWLYYSVLQAQGERQNHILKQTAHQDRDMDGACALGIPEYAPVSNRKGSWFSTVNENRTSAVLHTCTDDSISRREDRLCSNSRALGQIAAGE
jgi:hypothetical protein